MLCASQDKKTEIDLRTPINPVTLKLRGRLILDLRS
jgi:hypothetical protein